MTGLLGSHLFIPVCPQDTLLHLAVQTQVETVLPLVVQAYRRAKLFPTAMAARNEKGWNPLHEMAGVKDGEVPEEILLEVPVFMTVTTPRM